MNYENEVWKPVPGYEGHYEVSDMGRARSLKRKKIKYIKPYLSSDGYYKFRLYLNSKIKRCSAHRIIYEAFVKQIDEGLAIDHINGIRTDNRITNLREATWYQNSIYGAEIRRNAGKTSSMYLGVDKIHSRGIAYYRVRHLSTYIATFRCEHIAGFVAKMVREGIIPPEPIGRNTMKKNKGCGKA